MTSAVLIPPTSFPDLLRTWRKSRKLSQCDLLLPVGVSQRHLSCLVADQNRDMLMSNEANIKLFSLLVDPFTVRVPASSS